MIFDRFRLNGKVALVTGGTRGIGLGIAHALGEAGARLVISGRKSGDTALQELGEAGYQADFLAADMEDPAQADKLVGDAVSLAGGLDILVNNAGVAMNAASEDFSDAEWRRQMAINLDSVFAASRAAIAPMRARGGGTIVNIGSISAMITNVPQHQVAYNASKAAVHQMTKSMASEFAHENIRINAIAPGYIVTDMTKGGLAKPDWAKIWNDMTPMGRPGEVEEVAAAALFLASPASSYMTGSIVVIDGGYTLR